MCAVLHPGPEFVSLGPARIQFGDPSDILSAVSQTKAFPYYGYMNVTLSLDDKLVKEVRKIAGEQDTTLTGLVRDYLEKPAAEHPASGPRRRERHALERSFNQLRFKVGNRAWRREDLYARS